MAYNKLQTLIRVAGVGASWRAIRCDTRPMNMGLGREIRGPEEGQAYFRKFRDDGWQELRNDLDAIEEAANNKRRVFDEAGQADKLIGQVRSARTWEDLKKPLLGLTMLYRSSLPKYGDAPLQRVNESGRPQPGRFQQQNRLGWNEQQFKSFIEHIKPGSSFRRQIQFIARMDPKAPVSSLYPTINEFGNSLEAYIKWFTQDHPYPGIAKLLYEYPAARSDKAKIIAQQIEKRLFRLYDFARLQALKSVYAAALKSAIEL